jgi:3-hydroxyacyl-CoA dehydrogenase
MALGEAEKVAIIGAGTMGRQIALQLAAYGVEVALYDLALLECTRRLVL